MTTPTLNKDAVFLSQLREKWCEVPVGNTRALSRDLLSLNDSDFLSAWKENDVDARKWYQDRYGPEVIGKNVLDLGCGFSVDGIYFANCGAKVTFADIIPDNLDVTKRTARLFGIDAEFYLIDDVTRFNLPATYDYIFAIGSLHHSPFDLAKAEVEAVCKFLCNGGRFCFFSYPKERYDSSGAKDFADFGRMTDGDRTPWAEWYDDDKIKRLFGPEFTLVFSRNFGPHEIEFNWFELVKR